MTYDLCCIFLLTYVFHVRFTFSICPYVEAKPMGFKQRCQESAGVLAVGARVRLMGLSQAHFNGLEGYVTGAGGSHDGSHITAIVCVAMVPYGHWESIFRILGKSVNYYYLDFS